MEKLGLTNPSVGFDTEAEVALLEAMCNNIEKDREEVLAEIGKEAVAIQHKEILIGNKWEALKERIKKLGIIGMYADGSKADIDTVAANAICDTIEEIEENRKELKEKDPFYKVPQSYLICRKWEDGTAEMLCCMEFERDAKEMCDSLNKSTLEFDKITMDYKPRMDKYPVYFCRTFKQFTTSQQVFDFIKWTEEA